MICGHVIISTRTTAGLLTCLLAILFIPLHASSTRDSSHYCDVGRELTLSGTVSGVLTKPASGMTMGSHLLLTTAIGSVDVSLGRWGLQGKDALPVTVGQQVEVTGVMETLMDKVVFVVRVVKMGDKAYTIRNEHGIPLSPQARERVEMRQKSIPYEP